MNCHWQQSKKFGTHAYLFNKNKCNFFKANKWGVYHALFCFNLFRLLHAINKLKTLKKSVGQADSHLPKLRICGQFGPLQGNRNIKATFQK